jgi:hypothetical protein
MKKYYCKDCKKEISDYRVKRCRKCVNKYMAKKFKGKNAPMFGKYHSEKSKIKMSKTRIDKGLGKGKNNGMYGVHRFGKKAPSYIDGRTNNSHFCKSCNIKISVNNWRSGQNQCRKCSKSKKAIVRHHIDLDRRNNHKNNMLIITARKHLSLHHRAYDYLVKIGKIRQYIKWFLKTYKGNKKRG